MTGWCHAEPPRSRRGMSNREIWLYFWFWVPLHKNHSWVHQFFARVHWHYMVLASPYFISSWDSRYVDRMLMTCRMSFPVRLTSSSSAFGSIVSCSLKNSVPEYKKVRQTQTNLLFRNLHQHRTQASGCCTMYLVLGMFVSLSPPIHPIGFVLSFTE